MADFWIKLEKNTPDKPEIYEIAEILAIDPDAVLGKLIRVWCWLDSNSENGHIKSVTHVLIDRITMSQGFADAMVTVGWLSDNGVPNFSRHLGESAKKRAKNAERKRLSRSKEDSRHTKSVTESGLDKSRVDKSILDNKKTDFSVFNLDKKYIDEIVRIRKQNDKGKSKGQLSQRAANGLAKEIHAAVMHGYSIDVILTEWDLAKWQSFKLDWLINRLGEPERLASCSSVEGNKSTKSRSIREELNDTSWAK